jgi:hypothetical protein
MPIDPNATGFVPVQNFSVGFDISTLNDIGRVIDTIRKPLLEIKYKEYKFSEGIEPSALSTYLNILLTRQAQLEDRITALIRTIYDLTTIIERIFYEARVLKDRVALFDQAKKPGPEGEAAEKALKQTWLDSVDARKGEASLIHLSRVQGRIYTDVFFAMKKPEDFDKVVSKPEGPNAKDIQEFNNRVRTLVIGRLQEYLNWKEYTEKELRTRLEIDMNRLKTEYEAYKLYVSMLAQYLNIKSRIQITTASSPKEFTSGVGGISFLDNVKLKLDLMFYNETLYRNFKVIYFTPKENRKMKQVLSAIPQIKVINKRPGESDLAYNIRVLKKMGPKIVTAVEAVAEFSFSVNPQVMLTMQGGMFPPSVFQGYANITIYSYVFTPQEFDLLTAANAKYLEKTVYQQLNVVKSLEPIKAEIEKLIAEFDKQQKSNKVMPKQDLAITEIIQSFKEDFFGIKNSIVALADELSEEHSSLKMNADINKLNERLINKFGRKEVLLFGKFLAYMGVNNIYNTLKKVWIPI